MKKPEDERRRSQDTFNRKALDRDTFDRAFVGNPLMMLILIALAVFGSYLYHHFR